MIFYPFFDPKFGVPMNYTREQIANALDLAVLKPTTTEHHVWSACEPGQSLWHQVRM